MYKPNLVPNEPKDGSFGKTERDALIEKNGGIKAYVATQKKDGCRLAAGLPQGIVTRSLKSPGSKLVLERFEALQQVCLDLNILLDGEFYMHGLKFNEIFRFFSKSDVTTPEYRKELEKLKEKHPKDFYKKYRGRDIDFLTTFHEELEFWIFDGIVLNRPDLIGYKERMVEINDRLSTVNFNSLSAVLPITFRPQSLEELYDLYEEMLGYGWEGLVLTHNNHAYKNGRSTLKSGTILKLKDDKREYDGIVLDVEESTVAREGSKKTINELGRSKTSQLKEDRIPSGMAKSFVVQFEDIGTFPVGLNGFNHEERKRVLENKDDYIGRHFKYTGMVPVKDFPRHAYFACWRDEK